MINENNKPEKTNKFDEINKKYIYALLITAICLLLSQILIQNKISNLEKDSNHMYILGRQQMLSQKMAKTTYGLFLSKTKKEFNSYMFELIQAENTWKANHLIIDSRYLYADEKETEEIKEFYDDLNAYHKTISLVIYKVEKEITWENKDLIDYSEYMGELENNEEMYLECVNNINLLYKKNSEGRIEEIQKVEILMVMGLLILLLIEWILIFKPTNKEVEEDFQLMKNKEIYIKNLFETTPSISVLVESETFQIKKYNESAKTSIEDWLNVNIEENKNFYDILKDMKTYDITHLQNLLKEKDFSNYELEISKNKIVLMSSKRIEIENKLCYLIGFSDITDIKKMATIDDLTSMFNRMAGLELLEKLFKKERKDDLYIVFCFIDIDKLRDVNDEYGHKEGDYYIKNVSEKIIENTSDIFTAVRYGGDEIALIGENISRKVFQERMFQIEEKLEYIRTSENKLYIMDVSYGYASTQDKSIKNIEQLIEKSDMEMYKLKFKKQKIREQRKII